MKTPLLYSLVLTLFVPWCSQGEVRQATTSGAPDAANVDPIVQASLYGDKYVWSYHQVDKNPLPWTMFKPNDYCTIPVDFDGAGVRSVGHVPAPGMHPRIFFSPEDLPALRIRLRETRAGREAWKNVLSYANALKLTYDPKADYAQPDWMNGGFGIHGRVPLYRTGGYGKREDFYLELMEGKKPSKPWSFFNPASLEAFRCLIENDAQGARKLALATMTAVKLEQERRAAKDKPVEPGQPPNPSTGRLESCNLGLIYDFIYNWMTDDQRKFIHDELVTLSAWHDNYGSFNDPDGSRSNWATFSYWVFDLMAIEGEPGFNDLKLRGLYRGWRNFLTAGFFKSGAAYEAEGKLLLGLDAVVAFDRVADKYGLQPLATHPTPRNHLGTFTVESMLPTRDSFAVFDMLGAMGRGMCVPGDAIVAKYLYPQDKRLDLVYRNVVEDDYRGLPNRCDYNWNGVIVCALFATDYDPENTPEKANIPLTFFCGQRALMMTRSSWDKDATFLTLHVRGASGGHPYRDRNGIMLAAQGRPWVTIPGDGGQQQGWACDTMLIDGREQNNTTPGRVVDFVDRPQATFAVGDSKYCWDWVWSVAGRTKDGKPITAADVDSGNVETNGWELVNQSFNDFAYTKQKAGAYDLPLKYAPSWIAPKGYLSSYMRQVNTPVLKSFRTAGVVRGAHPYALVVDDVQRDAFPTRYDWHLTLCNDVVQLKKPFLGVTAGDLLFAGKASLDAAADLKPGEPVLLVRVLEEKGASFPPTYETRENLNLLTLSTKASSPDFKVMLYAFKAGEPLPATSWNADHSAVAIAFPDQNDQVTFTPHEMGKTDVLIKRGPAEIIGVNHPVQTLVDPEDDALTQHLLAVGLRMKGIEEFHANQLDGLVASWSFDRASNGQFPADQPDGVAFTADKVRADSNGVIGGCVRFDGEKEGMTAKLDLTRKITDGITVSFWVKVDHRDGNIVNLNNHSGISFDFIQGDLRYNTQGVWGPRMNSSTLSSWNNFVYTWNGQRVTIYRDSQLVADIPCTGKFSPPRSITLGGGKFAGCIDDLRVYDQALRTEVVEKIYLKGSHLGEN